MKTGVSDNVGGVKFFLSALRYALMEERHFALVGEVRYSTSARLQSSSGQELSPTHASLRSARIMIASSNSPSGERAAQSIYSVFACTPTPVPGWPACGPKLFHCS
jgi:hypothetical protein